MKTVTVAGDQSWFDVAVQELGTIEGVFGLLGSVDRLDENPIQARIIKLPDVIVKSNVDYYSRRGIIPATGNLREVTIAEGIGYWAIGYNFEIS
jgi:hypothetical protein